jgi:hypothetical protein
MLMRKLLLLPILAAIACSGQARPAHFDTTTIPPKQPGDPYSLLRFANNNVDTAFDQINGIALSDDYLFVAANWGGVYRFPKYGGPVSVVQEGGSSEYSLVAANRKTVFWDDDSFGPGDSPGGEIRSRSAVGGSTSGVTPINVALFVGNRMLRADAQYLYYVAAPASQAAQSFELRRVPIGGGAVTTMFTLTQPGPGISAPESAFTPSFIIDAGDVFFIAKQGTEVDVIAAGSTSPKKLLDLPTNEGPLLVGADASTLFFDGSGHSLYSAPRAGGTLTTIYTAPDKTYAMMIAVDDKNVYFSQSEGPAAAIYALAKSGGTPARIGRSSTSFLSGAVEQDDKNLFFAHQGEVLMLPKTPVGVIQ